MGTSNIFSCERKVIDLNSKDMFSIESFTTLQKLSSDKIDPKTRTIHDMLWISMDAISRNRSLYESAGYWEAMNSPYIQELLHRGTWFGELDHPDANCSRERFLKVDKDNISHRLVRYKRVGNDIRGDVQFVKPKGDIPWDWIETGSNISLSTRVLTPNYEEREDAQGNPYIHKFGKMRLVTFDCISSAPGFKPASIVEDVDSYDASQENWKGLDIHWTASRKKEEFMNLLNSQESLPIMEDIYGFSMKDVKNISYSEEGLISLLIKDNGEYSQSIKIPTNVYKVNQILCGGR